MLPKISNRNLSISAGLIAHRLLRRFLIYGKASIRYTCYFIVSFDDVYSVLYLVSLHRQVFPALLLPFDLTLGQFHVLYTCALLCSFLGIVGTLRIFRRLIVTIDLWYIL